MAIEGNNERREENAGDQLAQGDDGGRRHARHVHGPNEEGARRSHQLAEDDDDEGQGDVVFAGIDAGGHGRDGRAHGLFCP